MSKELLRNLPLFAGLGDDELDRLYTMARRVKLAAGDVLMTEGEVADTAFVGISGTFEVTKRAGAREMVIAQRGAGEIIGEIALLEDARRSATVRAATDAELLEISRATFEDLLQKCPDAAVSVIQTITARLRNTELMLRQSEKMAALGTLSAGLAHELNNPAAAVQRGSAQLQEAVADLHVRTTALTTLDLSPAQIATIEALRGQLHDRLGAAAITDPIARGDAVSDLQDWLEDAGVAEAWEIAPAISLMGWNAADLAAITDGFDRTGRVTLVCWLAAASNVAALLDEVNQASDRILEIVRAVKSYSYLDRGPVQLLDVHDGLENTLVILRHRLKHGINVERDYDRTLPRIEAHGSELNQVWTNIVDNAVDAMAGSGAIRIRTYTDPTNLISDDIVVEITDNGPGIPAEVQGRIFEAFFTTKEPGSGTGLGMHIAYNLVVNQHHGEITVKSQPGETTFTVKLPVRLDAG